MTAPNPTPGASGLDPSMGPAELHQLAQSRPDLWVAIIDHPNTYPGLLEWFKQAQRPDVQSALAARQQREKPAPAVPQPGPAPAVAQPRPAPAVPQPSPAADQPTPARSGGESVPARAVPGTGFRPPEGPKRSRPQPQTPEPSRSTPQTNAPVPAQAPVRRAVVTPEVDDRTVLAKRARKALGTLAYGAEPVTLTKERVIIGRTLKGLDDTPALQLVRVTDPTRTVSGTHAELRYKNGSWYIKDLKSTNGVYLVEPDGQETELEGIEALTDEFYLGDVKFTYTTA